MDTRDRVLAKNMILINIWQIIFHVQILICLPSCILPLNLNQAARAQQHLYPYSSPGSCYGSTCPAEDCEETREGNSHTRAGIIKANTFSLFGAHRD